MIIFCLLIYWLSVCLSVSPCLVNWLSVSLCLVNWLSVCLSVNPSLDNLLSVCMSVRALLIDCLFSLSVNLWLVNWLSVCLSVSPCLAPPPGVEVPPGALALHHCPHHTDGEYHPQETQRGLGHLPDVRSAGGPHHPCRVSIRDWGNVGLNITGKNN